MESFSNTPAFDSVKSTRTGFWPVRSVSIKALVHFIKLELMLEKGEPLETVEK